MWGLQQSDLGGIVVGTDSMGRMPSFCTVGILGLYSARSHFLLYVQYASSVSCARNNTFHCIITYVTIMGYVMNCTPGR